MSDLPGLKGLDHVSVGYRPDCVACDYVDDEGGFSTIDCDACYSDLAGQRYPAHGITEDGTKVHLDVCTDCVETIAYG